MQTSQPDAPEPRPKSEAPFLWQNKRALQKIKNDPLKKKPATTILIYMALTWIASDEESPTFEASLDHIADKVCLSARIVPRYIKQLERAGVIHVIHGLRPDGKKVNEMNRYTLLKMVAPKKPKAENDVPTGEGNPGTPEIPKGRRSPGDASTSRNLNNPALRAEGYKKKPSNKVSAVAASLAALTGAAGGKASDSTTTDTWLS